MQHGFPSFPLARHIDGTVLLSNNVVGYRFIDTRVTDTWAKPATLVGEGLAPSQFMEAHKASPKSPIDKLVRYDTL